MEQNTKYCQKCKKNVIATNYMIHQAMCRGLRQSQLFRSRVICPEDLEYSQPLNVPIQNNNQNIHQNIENPFKKNKIPDNQVQRQESNPNNNPRNIERQNYNSAQSGQTMLQYPNPNNINPTYARQNTNQFLKNQQPQQNQKIQRQTPQIPEERFPCTFCGYNMTMQELDTHPNICKIKKSKCQYCNSQFPADLMNDHYQVCQSREEAQIENRRAQRQSRRRDRIRESIEQDQRGQHYHFVDQTGQQFCANVTIDANGNRYTNTHPVNQRNNNPFSGSSGNPFLSLLGMFAGIPTSGGFNFQTSSNNGVVRFGNNIARNSGQSSRDNYFQEMIRGLLQRMSIRPENRAPLSENMLKKLPIVVFDKSNKQHQGSSSCTICMTDFQNGDQLIMLPCGHLFNKQCIVPWLKNSSCCPNCRQPVKVGTKPSHSSNPETNSNPQNTNNNQNPFQPRSQIQNNRVNNIPNQPTTQQGFMTTNPFSVQNNQRNNSTSNNQILNPFSANTNPNQNRNLFGNRGRNDW